MASTVPRGAVRLEAEAAMGLDSVVTLALGLGTGGTAEKRLRPDPGPEGVPSMKALGLKGPARGLGPHQAPQEPRGQRGSGQRAEGPVADGIRKEAGSLGSPSSASSTAHPCALSPHGLCPELLTTHASRKGP